MQGVVRMDPFDARFWKEYAQNSSDSDLVSRGLRASLWDSYGAFFGQCAANTGYPRTVREVVALLRGYGVLQPSATVLDVAAGPGTYSVPLAARVRDVTCVDISPVMVEMLEEEARRRNITNIEAVCADWFSYQSGGSYDLVFCGMGPVLDDVRSIDLMLAHSKRYISLVYWAGLYEHDLFHRLYRRVVRPETPWMALNAVVIFNYLIGLGYSPEIKFLHTVWQMEVPAKDLVGYLLWILSFYKDIDADDAQFARELVDEIASEEMARDVTRARLAFIFLDKEAGQSPDVFEAFSNNAAAKGQQASR